MQFPKTCPLCEAFVRLLFQHVLRLSNRNLHSYKVGNCLKQQDFEHRNGSGNSKTQQALDLDDRRGIEHNQNAYLALSCVSAGIVSFGSVACGCGAEEQTVDHVVLQCPIHRPPHGLHDLTVLDDETIEWLLNTCPKI